MKTSITILALALLAFPCFAGTNVTVRVLADEHSDSRWQVYSHGANVVLKIHHRKEQTSITSSASGYSVTHTDRDGDGTTDSITVSAVGGDILEVLKRDSDGAYVQTEQKDLDEMNRIARKIEERLPKQKE